MWTVNNYLVVITVVVILSLLGQYKPGLKLPNSIQILIGVGIYFSLQEGWLILPGYMGYIGFAAIIIFYGIPYGLSRLLVRACAKADWKQAEKYARWIAWFHPSNEWRKAPLLYQALDLFEQEQYAAAEAILQPLQSIKGTWINRVARQTLYRFRGRWSELALDLQPPPDAEIQPDSLEPYLEALAESGDLNRLVAAFQRYQPALQQLDDRIQRHAYIALFTFVGRADLVERVIEPIKHTMTPNRVLVIKATAELVAGNPLPMQAMVDVFSDRTWPESLALVERRLAHPPPSPATLTAENKARLLEIEQKWGGYIGPAQGQRY